MLIHLDREILSLLDVSTQELKRATLLLADVNELSELRARTFKGLSFTGPKAIINMYAEKTAEPALLVVQLKRRRAPT